MHSSGSMLLGLQLQAFVLKGQSCIHDIASYRVLYARDDKNTNTSISNIGIRAFISHEHDTWENPIEGIRNTSK